MHLFMASRLPTEATLLPTDLFRQKPLHIQKFSEQILIHTNLILHSKTLTQRQFYKQEPLHTDPFFYLYIFFEMQRHLLLPNVFRATTGCHFSFCLCLDPCAPAAVPSLLFDLSERKTECFVTSIPVRAPVSSPF